MSQTVIILLLNAVVTIIVTVVTVRFTMTGRVVSQTTKDKLTTRADRYGVIVLTGILVPMTAAMLIYTLRKTAPLTREEVWVISFLTSALWAEIILFSVAIALTFFKRNQ